MTIQWLGSSTLKIQTKNNLIVVDPFEDQGSVKMPRLKADVVITTNPESACCNNVQRIQGDPFVIEMPGEYEINETFIYGYQGGRENDGKNILFTIKAEGISIGILGALDHDLSKTQLSGIEGVDVLFVPIHKNPVDRLVSITSIAEPRILVPYYFQTTSFSNLDKPEAFLKEMGAKGKEAEEKLVLKAGNLPQEETELHLLTADQK